MRLTTTAGPKRSSGRARPLLVGELAVIAALLVVYDRVRALADVRSTVADAHGWAILHAETVLHLRIEDNLNAWLTRRDLVRMLAVDFYQYLHVSVALAVLVVCYLSRPHVYRPVRNALVLTNVVGLAVFAVYPAAPPRLLPGAGFVDSVADAGFSTSHGPIAADQYGALPSLHLAWATWVAVAGFALTRHRAARGLFVAYPVLTAFVVMATGNHYVLDVASGVLLGLTATWVTGLIPRNVVVRSVGRAAAPVPVTVVTSPSMPSLNPASLGPHWLLEPESPEP